MPTEEIRLVLTVDAPFDADTRARIHRDTARSMLVEWGIGSYEASEYGNRHVSSVRFLDFEMDTDSYPSEISFPVTKAEKEAENYDDDDF